MKKKSADPQPRGLFVLLLLTSFMALAYWALEVHPPPTDGMAASVQKVDGQ